MFAVTESTRQALWDRFNEILLENRMDRYLVINLKTVVHYLEQIHSTKACWRRNDIRQMLVYTHLRLYSTEDLISQLAELAAQSTSGGFMLEGTAFHTLFVTTAERLQPTESYIPDDCDNHVRLLLSLMDCIGRIVPVQMLYPYEKHVDMLLTGISSKWQHDREYACYHLGDVAKFMYGFR